MLNQSWFSMLIAWLWEGRVTQKQAQKNIDDIMDGVGYNMKKSDSVWHQLNRRYGE